MYCRAQLKSRQQRQAAQTTRYSRVTVGEDETVTVDPLGVLGVELHEAGPEDVSGRGETLQ